jgi:FkbM family methyltransferase
MRFIFLLKKITKRMYPYRGISRIADLVRMAYIHSHHQFLIRDFDGDLLFNCALNEHISSQVFWRGYYSRDQLYLLRNLLKPGMVFLDVGANKGEFTVFAAKYTAGADGGMVYAFEPVEALCEELTANVTVNGFQHVQIIRKGLGNTRKKGVLYNAQEANNTELNMGTFTLYPRTGVDHPGVMIEIMPLDDFVREQRITRVDVIKIDIEGGELAMLEGAAETISRWKPVIFIEINSLTSRAAGYDPGLILRFLEARGYQCAHIGRNGKTRIVREKDLTSFQNLICRPVPAIK